MYKHQGLNFCLKQYSMSKNNRPIFYISKKNLCWKFEFWLQSTSGILYEGIFFRTTIIQNMFNFMSDYMITPIV